MTKYDYVKTKREDVQAMTEKQQAFGKKFIKIITRAQVWTFKKTNGKFWKNFPGGFPICVVGTTGAKSGLRREVALIHVADGENKYLVASQGGMDKSPFWFYNIRKNPEVDIMFGGETKEYKTRQISDEEKAAAWPLLLSFYPDFDEYQARTDRNIPVFICEPI